MADFDNQDEMMEGGRPQNRFSRRAKICAFCADKSKVINYKESDMLRRFLTDNGKIRPRRQTGTCARHQRRLAVAVKQSRHLALLPFEGDTGRGD
jgi:small subunit ribosomal protein S18